MLLEIISILSGLYLFMIMYFHFKYPEIRWNWDDIATDTMQFPPTFIWGTATAAHQVEGNCTNNWSAFEKGTKEDGQPNIKDNQQSGLACDHWNRYPEDITLIKELSLIHILRAHETVLDLVCRLLLEKKKKKRKKNK